MRLKKRGGTILFRPLRRTGTTTRTRARPPFRTKLFKPVETTGLKIGPQGVQRMHTPTGGRLPKVTNDDVGARGDIRRHPPRLLLTKKPGEASTLPGFRNETVETVHRVTVSPLQSLCCNKLRRLRQLRRFQKTNPSKTARRCNRCTPRQRGRK